MDVSVSTRVTSAAQASGGTAAWTPAALSPIAWFRADNLTLSGSSVTGWPDLSGNSRNLSVPGGSGSPTRLASVSAIGGQPAVDFDGVNDTLHYVGAINQPYMVHVVASVAAAGSLFDGSSSTVNQSRIRAASTAQMIASADGVNAWNVGGPGYSTTAWQAASVQFSGATGAMETLILSTGTVRDGIQLAGSGIGTNNMSGLALSPAYGRCECTVAELLVTGVLSTGDLDQLQSYFLERYT